MIFAHYTKFPLLSGSIQLIQNVLHTAYEIHWENMFWWRTLSKHQLIRVCSCQSEFFFNLTVAEWVAQGSGQHTTRPGQGGHGTASLQYRHIICLLAFSLQMGNLFCLSIYHPTKLDHVTFDIYFSFFGSETLSYETQTWYFLQKHNAAEHFFEMLPK